METKDTWKFPRGNVPLDKIQVQGYSDKWDRKRLDVMYQYGTSWYPHILWEGDAIALKNALSDFSANLERYFQRADQRMQLAKAQVKSAPVFSQTSLFLILSMRSSKCRAIAFCFSCQPPF